MMILHASYDGNALPLWSELSNQALRQAPEQSNFGIASHNADNRTAKSLQGLGIDFGLAGGKPFRND
jgi:hypothetical protein